MKEYIHIHKCLHRKFLERCRKCVGKIWVSGTRSLDWKRAWLFNSHSFGVFVFYTLYIIYMHILYIYIYVTNHNDNSLTIQYSMKRTCQSWDAWTPQGLFVFFTSLAPSRIPGYTRPKLWRLTVIPCSQRQFPKRLSLFCLFLNSLWCTVGKQTSVSDGGGCTKKRQQRGTRMRYGF